MFDFDSIEYATLDTERALFVDVYKIGGGTLGKAYTGELWAARVTDTAYPANVLLESTDLYVGSTADHAKAGAIALDMATEFSA